MIGIVSMVFRKQIVNCSSSLALVGIGILGAGATAWRIYKMNLFMRRGSGVDPDAWMLDQANAWMVAGVVMPAVGVGLLMVAVSVLLTKSPTQ